MTKLPVNAPRYEELARNRADVQRSLSAADCPRLGAAVIEVDSIEIRARFDWYDRAGRRRPMSHAELALRVCLLCHRCEAPLWRDLQGECQVVIAESEADATALDADMGPERERLQIVVVDQPTLSLVALFEDELLLMLPSLPGEDHACDDPPSLSYGDLDGSNEDTAEIENPFAVLAKLKEDK
ncbi:MAG: YceD family protein [Pseudomonadota bacterium]